MQGLLGGGSASPTRLNAVKINQSCQGLPLPVIMGKHKVQQSALWMNGFGVQEVQGGKGGGKGAGYLYSSDAIVGLCEGPITAVDDVWYNQSWLSNAGANENITVPATGIYTPLGASTITADAGVSQTNSYSVSVQDFSAPTTTTYSGTTQTPFQKVPYGTTLAKGQYSFNEASVDAPFTVTSCDSASGGNTVYHGTFPGGAANGFVGYTWIIQGFTNQANDSITNDATTGFICVASTATTLTLANPYGVAETPATPGTATEPGNTYHFSLDDADDATPVQISYSFKLNYVRAQEVDIVPDSMSIYVGAPFYYGVDEGVIYYGSDNPLNGQALQPTSANPPTSAGTYYFISSGKGGGGSQYIFATADIGQEVLITYQYQNDTLIPNDAPSTLNFTVFNGAEGQPVWSFLEDTFPQQALNYGATAYAAFQPMELGGEASPPNITYEVQTADSYGGGIVDCNPVNCLLRVLTDPIWGLGSGQSPFPLQIIDNGPTGTWGFPQNGGPIITSTPTTITTGPVTVKAYASSGAGWQGLGGTLLSTTTVNTPVFNQVIQNYPIYGFSAQTNIGTGGGYKLNPMVAVETTSNGTLLDKKTITGTTGTFTLDMTGTFTVPAAGTYTFWINYANYSSWAFYVQGATLLGGTTPPSSNTISTGDGHPAFPSTGPTTGYTKMGEQSKDDGSHPTPSTMHVSFAAAGTYNYEAVYVQTSAISFSGEANGYFQITTANGSQPTSPSGGQGTVGVVILPTVSAASVPTATTAFNWFASNGYFISVNMDKQDTASSIIGKWLEGGQCAGYMSEGLMKLVPFGDTTTTGNGCTWLAPSTFVVALDDSCFIAKDGEDPVRITRSAWQDGYNYCQIKWANRQNQYSDEVTPEFDQSAINRFGLRREEPQDYDFLCNLTSATFAAIMRVKRSVNIRNTYEFDLPFVYSYLEPMDICYISTTSIWAQALTSNANLGVVNLPVRITKVVDDPTEGLKITAEDYPYGVGQPVLFNKGINASEIVADLYANPGTTEAILFEPTGRQTANYSGNQIWIGATGQSNEWGGCNILVSSDGSSYKQIGTITDQARLGELNQTFNIGSDPDENNVLVVDMAENTPPIEAGSTSDADQGNTLCYVDGEVIAYSSATVTNQGQYTFNLGAPSVPGYIRRGQLGSSIGVHLAGSLFMRLDDTIFKYTYDPVWYGKTIYFKFQSFNKFQHSTQDQSTLTAVPFTIGGRQGAIDAGSGLVLTTQPKTPVRKPILPPIGIGRLGWQEVVNAATWTPLPASVGNGYSGPWFTSKGQTESSDSGLTSGICSCSVSGGLETFDGYGGSSISAQGSALTQIGKTPVTFTAIVGSFYDVIGAGGQIKLGIANGYNWVSYDTYLGFQLNKNPSSAYGNWFAYGNQWKLDDSAYNSVLPSPVDTGVQGGVAGTQTLSITVDTTGVVKWLINGVVVATSVNPMQTDATQWVTGLGMQYQWASTAFTGLLAGTVESITLQY
jgi:hypothetical protein